MKRIVFILSVIVILVLAAFALQNRFLFGVPFVRLGMTENEVFQRLGYPDIYANQTFDNWYLVRFYPFILGALNVEIDMRDAGVVDQNGHSGDHVIWIAWKPAFCLDTKEDVHRLSH
jgi:hypothetical protein